MLKGWWPEMEDTLPSDGGGCHPLNTHASLYRRKGLNQGQPQFPKWPLDCTLPPRGLGFALCYSLYSKHPQARLTVTTAYPTPSPQGLPVLLATSGRMDCEGGLGRTDLQVPRLRSPLG